MGVETLGEAYMLGWRIHVRCAWGRREAMKGVRSCLGRAELDLHTLIWIRVLSSRALPLEGRSKCPLCGSRRVTVIFEGARRKADRRNAEPLDASASQPS